ncbi:MAG TPA: hypothetical protein PK156_04260 [Polyangium sp.]|nr:hypothetical protein [Polyangium sp.]
MKLHRTLLALVMGMLLAIPAALSLAEGKRAGYVPDPAGVASTKQWVFDVQVRQGVPTLAGARLVTLDKPASTARVLGRFAVEFWIGKELLDRVRFDVPLLADPTKRKNRRLGAPEFAVNTRLSVRLADSARATSLVFVDRATGETQVFAWPPGSNGELVPVSRPISSSADAGPDAPASDAAEAPDAL